MALLTEQHLGKLLRSFRRSAFRFEIRDRYNSDVGREAFRRFRAGEPDDYAWHSPWLDMIRSDRQRGKLWQRVRIVSVPLSDWSRYGMVVARLNVEAGEDIRYLRRDVAEQIGLAPYDSWLFDSAQLVRLHFDDADDTFAGAERIEDDDAVHRHRGWRDLAWRHAQPIDDFSTTVT